MLSTAMLWKTLRWTREIIRTDLNREWVSSVEPKLIDLWGARMFEWLMLHIITNQHPKVVMKWSVWFCLATPEHTRKSTDATLPYTDFALRSRSGGESAALLVLEGSHDEVVTWQLWPSIFGSLGKNCQHTHNLSGITEFSSFLELLSPCTLSSTPYPQECLDLWKLKLYIYIYLYTFSTQQRCQGWCACLSARGRQGCSTTRTETWREWKVRDRWFETSEVSYVECCLKFSMLKEHHNKVFYHWFGRSYS